MRAAASSGSIEGTNRVTRARISACCLFLACTIASAEGASGEQRQRPDVVIIVSHCLGYSDLGCYGGEIRTPNLDALAADGVRMAHANQNCSRTPSQAALMTGQYAHRLGVIEGVKKGFLNTIGKIKNDHPHASLAEVFSSAGYHTLADGNFQGWSPELLGFSEHLKTHGEVGWKQCLVWKGGKPPHDRKPTVDDVAYAAEESGTAFAQAITRVDKDRPLFGMWVSRTSMYGMFAKEADVASYHQAYQVGARAIAQQRYERTVRLGLVEEPWPWSNPVSPELDGAWPRGKHDVATDADMIAHPEWTVGYGSNGIRKPKSYAEMMAIYAAQTTMFDRCVGKITAALKETGRYENTLLLFCVLEGADSHSGSKGTAWAQATAVPFTGLRRSAHSGAITSPMIISWPARIAAKTRGTINHAPCHLPDLMPTALAAAGVAVPDRDEQGRAIPAGDGQSLLAVLTGESVARPQPIFFELIGHRGAITEQWKWIDGRLYDLHSDRLETKDVANAHAAVTASLAQGWKQWADEVGAHQQDYDVALKAKLQKRQKGPVE